MHFFKFMTFCAMLYLVGLGLSDERDISVKGLEIVRRCESVYLEAYTSILLVPKEKLEGFYGREVILADRETVEQKVDCILEKSLKQDVAFLVVGDPFGATTHSDLVLRAKQMNVKVEIIHNASILNAIGVCGLQLYRFGEAVSIPYFTDTWRPDSFYDKIKLNRSLGFHTLCLLDIRVKEPSIEAMSRGKIEYEPPRFMTVNEAIEQLLEIEENRKEKAYDGDTIAVGAARVGSETQMIIADKMENLKRFDFGPPLHSLVIVGQAHFMEDAMLNSFMPTESTPLLHNDAFDSDGD